MKKIVSKEWRVAERKRKNEKGRRKVREKALRVTLKSYPHSQCSLASSRFLQRPFFEISRRKVWTIYGWFAFSNHHPYISLSASHDSFIEESRIYFFFFGKTTRPVGEFSEGLGTRSVNRIISGRGVVFINPGWIGINPPWKRLE